MSFAVETSEIDNASEAPKRAVFNGRPGRVLTDEEVNEILDFIILYGYCPTGLSRRMELYYMKHERLEERRKRFVNERKQRTGKHRQAVKAHGTATNIVQYQRRAAGDN